MGNTQRQPLTLWAQRVEAMHARQSSNEANEIREALPEGVRKNKALVEHLVIYLMETKASLDEHSDGSLPENMTKEEVGKVQAKIREARAALQSVPGAMKHLEPAFDDFVRNADKIEAFFTEREERIRGRYTSKRFVEEHVAYLLASHGIELKKYVAGDLANVLHVAYEALEGDPGTDAITTIRRLCEDAGHGFTDIEAHVRHHAFYKALLALPATSDPKELERQGEVYRKAAEAHQPEHPSMCVVMAEATVRV